MLFIYTPHDSPRIDYAMDFIFGNCLNLPVSQVEDLREVPDGEPLIVYSYVRPERPALWLFPHDLPLGFSIEPQKVEVFRYNDHPVFFGIEDGINADLPYDPVALVFFMLSRYEEYLSAEKDEHGRFPASASIAFKNGFLEHPVVDQAVEDIRLLLSARWPGLRMDHAGLEHEFTYDIDAPFAFFGKPVWKNLAGGMRDALTLRKTGRLAHLTGGKADPFDIFDSLLGKLSDQNIRARFFLLLEHRGRRNPSIDWRNENFQRMVRKLGDSHDLGLHPSYNCSDPEALRREMSRFESLAGYLTEHTRFHYLRMRLPASYHLVYNNGLFHDHSMAFPDHCGFRAGTSRTFRFYDLSAEVETDLYIHPFCFMDATFEYYMNHPDEKTTLGKIREISARIRAVNGRISWVFHNDLLSEYPSRLNWGEIHKMALEGLI